MRCDCCDVILTTKECRLKNKASGEYLNTCSKCLKLIPEIKVQYPKNHNDEDFVDDSIDLFDFSEYENDSGEEDE